MWQWIVRLTTLTFVALTVNAMLRSTPGTESVPDLGPRISELRMRVLGFLVPFWLSVLTLTWILMAQIRLHDRITASGMSNPMEKAS